MSEAWATNRRSWKPPCSWETDIVTITETSLDNLYNWSAAMASYKLFRDKQGRRGGGLALYVRECFDCLELNDGDNRVGCLWVKIRGRANRGDILVGLLQTTQPA